PVVIPVRELAPPKRLRTIGDYVALAIATCGVGYFPIAPGTMGSLLGVGIYILLWRSAVRIDIEYLDKTYFGGSYTEWTSSFFLMWILPLLVIGLSLIGIWAASRAERLMGKKDPSQVVIDEVAGQLVTFMFVPAYFLRPKMILIGFVLFRAFDIIKPYPIRRIEGLHGGLGIVGDDIVAGFYAGAVLALVALLAALHLLP
ncbi:MAG TPA: phosphatidylglycerophosphatase A, partial [Pyrinomonadaceae bacterium]|nr:phosphatidylglycerophosphatase A [Pyrinomonadaceae bacterium]